MSSSPSNKSQKSLSNSTKNAQKNNKLFVTSIDIKIPPEEIDSKLREIFEPKGTIIKIDVKKSFNNKYSFAFVEFAEPQVAAKVLSECKNCQINGKRITIDYQRSNPREKRNYPPRQHFKMFEKQTDFKKDYHTEREERQNPRQKDRDTYGDKYHEKKHQRHQKSRKHKRSYSSQEDKDRRKKSRFREENQNSRRDHREHRKRTSTPDYKHEKREENHKKHTDQSFYNKSFTGCFNCKSMNHLARDCPKGRTTHKESISPSKSGSQSDYRRHERSRRNPRNPEIRRREERRDRQRRYKQYSSDYSSNSSSSYHRMKKSVKKNKKYNRRSSSSDSRRKGRYH